jgi:hypothetical protein
MEVKDSLRPEMMARVALAERFQPGRGSRFQHGKLVTDEKILGEIHVWWLYDDGGTRPRQSFNYFTNPLLHYRLSNLI